MRILHNKEPLTLDGNGSIKWRERGDDRVKVDAKLSSRFLSRHPLRCFSLATVPLGGYPPL
jgi:hypothetical protein